MIWLSPCRRFVSTKVFKTRPMTKANTDILDFARSVLQQEAAGIEQLVDLLDENFVAATDALLSCQGHVVVTGVGKPWLIGQKISATLASTGTPSFALHPSEAMHGDLGRLRSQDVVVAMSNSGSSEEVVRLLPVVKRIGCTIVGLTGVLDSPLGLAADVLVDMGRASEACPIGMAPSVSTTIMLALGDALALSVMKARNFGPEDYAQFHPGGSLGRSLMHVHEVMQPLAETAVVPQDATVADALNAITTAKTGAAFVTDQGKLVGVFTDGDLRRHIQDDNLLGQAIGEVMTVGGQFIELNALATEAVHILEKYRRGELAVVDAEGQLVGQVLLKDMISMHFL